MTLVIERQDIYNIDLCIRIPFMYRVRITVMVTMAVNKDAPQGNTGDFVFPFALDIVLTCQAKRSNP